jgi:quercetin dioxygenase-like cupin family protein
MITEKLKVLSEVNKKLVNFQNLLKIQLEYDDGTMGSFRLLRDEDIWVQDEAFGIGSRYKTLKQHNKTGEHNLAPVLFEGKKNNIVKTHFHRESHLFICLTGKIKVTLDNNDEYYLNPTESIYINSFQPHKFEFISNSKIIILVLNV